MGKPLRCPCGVGRKSCCGLLGIVTRVWTLEPGQLRPQGWTRERTAWPGGSSVVVWLREPSCGLELLLATLASWAGGRRKLFLWRRKRAGLELGSGSGHCALAHFTAPGHREDPLSKALCATSPTLGPVCCPLHFGRSHAPHPRPTGHRTPRSTGSEVSGKLPAGSPWHAPYPGGKPAAADDPEIVPAPSLELRGAHWPLQGRARRPRPPSAAHTGLRSGQGPSVGPESPSPGRACARAPLPAIMAASASERSR